MVNQAYKICQVNGCSNRHHAKGYCNIHYHQIKRIGRTTESVRYMPNKIIVCGDFIEIILLNKDSIEVGRAIVDNCDIEKVKDIKWHLNGTGYVQNKNGKVSILMHRLIMDCPENMVVDHINHNTLDNRRSNLRICTHQQNILNSKTRKDNTVGHKGVSFHKKWGWEAWIQLNKKKKHLAWFDSKEDAIKARKSAEKLYYGEFANPL